MYRQSDDTCHIFGGGSDLHDFRSVWHATGIFSAYATAVLDTDFRRRGRNFSVHPNLPEIALARRRQRLDRTGNGCVLYVNLRRTVGCLVVISGWGHECPANLAFTGIAVALPSNRERFVFVVAFLFAQLNSL